jgi:L-ornithine Nalpha-acyltransferase
MPTSRAHISPRRLLGGFWPAPRTRAGLLPTLRAYSGRVVHKRRTNYSEPLGTLGTLEVRLAQKASEVRRAQKLRYRIFFKEGEAIADAKTMLARRDVDAFDPLCDHLLVIDHAAQLRRLRKTPAVVGTYRLLRQEVAEQYGGFYSESEFEIAALMERHPYLKFLELGRSCVLAPYRDKRTLELLWHGIGSYLGRTKMDVMFGCASLEGIDPDRLALPLSYLHHFARAPEEWRTRALNHRYVEMNRLPKESINPKAALRALPPLIKGYLRAGAFVGDGAVIDYQFGTTDVLIVFPVEAIKARYSTHFIEGKDGGSA